MDMEKLAPHLTAFRGTWSQRNPATWQIPLYCGGTANVGSAWDPITSLLGETQANAKIKEHKAISDLQPTQNKSGRYR